MAAHCFGILSITDVLSEHIDVVEEIRLYATCSAIYSGNKVHRDILKELRDYYYSYNVIPTLQRHHSQGSDEGQETAQAAPPLYRYVWSSALKIYMIVVLSSCHLPTTLAGNLTDQGLVAGDRGGENVSSNIVNNSVAGLKEEFVADISTKWECMIFMVIMTIVCVISCVDVIIGKEILFHPYC